MSPADVPADAPVDTLADVPAEAAEASGAGGSTTEGRGARTGRRGEPDAVCAAAVALARTAAEELADAATVGDHLGVAAEGERLVVHSFACLSRGYRGWRWAVSVARAPRARVATVCEVVLLPATEALLPPAWVPWSERLAPGDVGAGDELPYREDDPLLEAGYEATDDDEADRVALWELGLGRSRVLSREGREAAAQRWYHGAHGPTADIAVHAAAACSSCGYLMQIAGGMRQMFGVCANEWSPSDGQVVSLDHGCGAHSETDAPTVEPEPLPVPILDEADLEPVVLPARDAVAVEEPPAGVSVAEVVAEVSEPGSLEVSDAASDLVASIGPADDEPDEVPDPEAPAHEGPSDPEAPAHEGPEVEVPVHEAVLEEPIAEPDAELAAEPVAEPVAAEPVEEPVAVEPVAVEPVVEGEAPVVEVVEGEPEEPEPGS